MPIRLSGSERPTARGLVIAFEAFRASLAIPRSNGEACGTVEVASVEEAIAAAGLRFMGVFQGCGLLFEMLIEDAAEQSNSPVSEVWRLISDKLNLFSEHEEDARSATIILDAFRSVEIVKDVLRDEEAAFHALEEHLDEAGLGRFLSGLFLLFSIPYELFVRARVESIAQSKARYSNPLTLTEQVTVDLTAHLYRQVAINRMDDRIAALVIRQAVKSPDASRLQIETRDAMLRELSPLLEHTIHLLDALLRDVDVEPDAISEYAAERARCRNDAETAGLVQCTQLARYGAYATLDHARTLLQLLDLKGGILGPIVITRAAIEAGSRSSWLLDSSLNVHERVSRAFAYRYSSAGWHSEVREAIGTFGDEDQKEVLRLATEAGMLVTNARSGRGKAFDDMTTLTETETVAWFVQKLGYARPPKLLYSIFSGMTHSRPAWRSLFASGSRSDVLVAQPSHRGDVLRSCIGLTLTSVMKAYADLFAYYSKGDDEWMLWAALILDTEARWAD